MFTTTDGIEGDPPSSSLMNLDTIKNLCELGSTVTNILKDKNETYGETFKLPLSWKNLTSKLLLTDERYLYMIWLWMDTAWDYTLIREKEGGSMQANFMSR